MIIKTDDVDTTTSTQHKKVTKKSNPETQDIPDDIVYDIYTAKLSALMCWHVIAFLTTNLQITTKYVDGKTGWIHKHKSHTPLRKIDHVDVKQGLFGEMFNYGTVTISSVTSVFNFKYMKYPFEIQEAFEYLSDLAEDEFRGKNANEYAKANAEALAQVLNGKLK